MARYYVHPCVGCGELKTMRLMGRGEEDKNILQCESCQMLHEREVAVVPKKKTTYPYYNASCGMDFESQSHEMKYAKANNLEKI